MPRAAVVAMTGGGGGGVSVKKDHFFNSDLDSPFFKTPQERLGQKACKNMPSHKLRLRLILVSRQPFFCLWLSVGLKRE